MKLFYTYNGVDHFGYTVFSPDIKRFEGHNIVFNMAVSEKIKTLEGLVDRTISPAKGSSVNVIQNCALPVATIRNNYTIKRGIDTADYNVFSPQETQWTPCYMTQILLYPKEKIAFIYKDKTTDLHEAADDFQHYVPDIPIIYDDCILIKRDTTNPTCIAMREFRNNTNEEAWIRLLEGTLTKPAISYSQLDITTDNELDADTLYIIYKLAMNEQFNYDNVQTILVQLKALEQMNIDLYPGTMTLLHNIFSSNKHALGKYICNRKGSWDKTVKRILSMSAQPSTQQDFEMGQALIERIFNMKDIKFTSMYKLLQKLRENNIPVWSFCTFYNDIVKLTKKTADDN